MSTILGTPDPVAFTVFGREIRWYAILMASAILISYFLFVKRSMKKGFKEDDLYDLFLVMIPMGVVGARLYYVLFYDLSYYLANPSKILAIWEGGLAVHGSIILGLLGVILVVRKKKWDLLEITDLLVPSLALGQAIGRWGNYFNMEAHGVETTLPWAIRVLENGKWINVHPTFLYESLWDLGVFLVLLLLIDRRKTVNGQTTCWYFIIYSVGRFWIEGLRTDSLMFLGLRQAQLISIVLIILGFGGLMILRRKKDLHTDLVPSEEDDATPLGEEASDEVISPAEDTDA